VSVNGIILLLRRVINSIAIFSCRRALKPIHLNYMPKARSLVLEEVARRSKPMLLRAREIRDRNCLSRFVASRVGAELILMTLWS